MTDTDEPDNPPEPDDAGPEPPDLREQLARLAASSERMRQAIADSVSGLDLTGIAKTAQAMDTSHTYLVNTPLPPNPQWETAHHTRRQADLFEENLRALGEAQAENERKEAERDAREQRALDLAEKSHRETVASKEETRRARILAAWSLAVAVLAVAVSIVLPLITG
jgi:hypothetical protein